MYLKIKWDNKQSYILVIANDRISLSDFENKTEFNRFRKRQFVNEKRLKVILR